jgi:outer membrane protein assembly factor BamB
MSRSYPLVLVLISTGFALPLRAENWPGWRGPRGDGTSTEVNVPTRWSPSDNIVWKADTLGRGHASPIVWNDYVFIASCLEEQQRRILIALDRHTGRQRWQQTVLESPLEEKHDLNSFASSTPATDGDQVYVTFLDRNQMVVAAYDLSGRQRWLVRRPACSRASHSRTLRHARCGYPLDISYSIGHSTTLYEIVSSPSRAGLSRSVGCLV